MGNKIGVKQMRIQEVWITNPHQHFRI